MTYGLIGEHLGHSFSPAIHERLSGLPYELHELAPGELEAFLRDEPFAGINVTIPYKKAVIPYLDALAPSAEETGAVNVIVRSQDGHLTGYNTDTDGFIAMARHSGIDFNGANVIILGAGGAAAASAYGARQLGAASVRYAVRSPKAPDQLPIGETSLYQDCEILVNATPVGMYPLLKDKPLDISALPHLRGVLDCIYNPIRTNLVLDAQALGIPAEAGLRMLAAQAVRASELFRGCTLDDSAIEDICSFLLARRRNIVLCGMPSCGKTTVAMELSSKLRKVFVDTDEVVRTHSGREIAQIFARDGEECFRRWERVAVEQASDMSGAVIATGGGTVLDPVNLRALRRTGIICFLDRPVAMLQPSADRPLSRNRTALDRLYDTRRAAYLAAADVVIPNAGSPSEAAERIIELYDR